MSCEFHYSGPDPRPCLSCGASTVPTRALTLAQQTMLGHLDRSAAEFEAARDALDRAFNKLLEISRGTPR